MLIGGLVKTTLIDYPGKIAAAVFTAGCNFRCPFCHNPELVDQRLIKKQPQIDLGAFFNFLKTKKRFLDGVCLTGGEPLIQPLVIDFIETIKQEGFLVKLDTNGSQPEKLEKLFQKNLLDFVAMDIKSSPEKYHQAIGGQFVNLENIFKSIELIQKSGVNYEFRTTAVPGLIDKIEIEKIGQWLKSSDCFVLQQFKREKNLNKSWQKIKPYSEEELNDLIEAAKPYFRKVELRGV